MITSHTVISLLESESGPDRKANGNHNDKLHVLSAYSMPSVNLVNPYNSPIKHMKKLRH